MKRKQIALLLSLVLSVSPMAEGAVVWGDTAGRNNGRGI